MRVERELGLSLALLVFLQIATALGAIGLLGRMTPAIEQILEENVYSAEAVEDMALLLARRPEAAGSDAQAAFRRALGRAKANVTEAGEKRWIGVLEEEGTAALAGEPGARDRTLEALAALGRINRDAMQEADDRAKRLGTAGAWAAAFLGGLGLLAGLFILARLRRRLLGPLQELDSVVMAQAAGDTHRRCAPTPGIPKELGRLMGELNALLDAREWRDMVQPDAKDGDARVALVQLLDGLAAPTGVVDGEGELLAANQTLMDRLGDEDGGSLRRALGRVPEGEGPPWMTVVPAGEGGPFIVELAPAKAEGD